MSWTAPILPNTRSAHVCLLWCSAQKVVDTLCEILFGRLSGGVLEACTVHNNDWSSLRVFFSFRLLESELATTGKGQHRFPLGLGQLALASTKQSDSDVHKQLHLAVQYSHLMQLLRTQRSCPQRLLTL